MIGPTLSALLLLFIMLAQILPRLGPEPPPLAAARGECDDLVPGLGTALCRRRRGLRHLRGGIRRDGSGVGSGSGSESRVGSGVGSGSGLGVGSGWDGDCGAPPLVGLVGHHASLSTVRDLG